MIHRRKSGDKGKLNEMDVTNELKEERTEELTSDRMLRVDHVIPWMQTAVNPDRRRRRKRRKKGVNQVLITQTQSVYGHSYIYIF